MVVCNLYQHRFRLIYDFLGMLTIGDMKQLSKDSRLKINNSLLGTLSGSIVNYI